MQLADNYLLFKRIDAVEYFYHLQHVAMPHPGDFCYKNGSFCKDPSWNQEAGVYVSIGKYIHPEILPFECINEAREHCKELGGRLAKKAEIMSMTHNRRQISEALEKLQSNFWCGRFYYTADANDFFDYEAPNHDDSCYDYWNDGHPVYAICVFDTVVNNQLIQLPEHFDKFGEVDCFLQEQGVFLQEYFYHLEETIKPQPGDYHLKNGKFCRYTVMGQEDGIFIASGKYIRYSAWGFIQSDNQEQAEDYCERAGGRLIAKPELQQLLIDNCWTIDQAFKKVGYGVLFGGSYFTAESGIFFDGMSTGQRDKKSFAICVTDDDTAKIYY